MQAWTNRHRTIWEAAVEAQAIELLHKERELAQEQTALARQEQQLEAELAAICFPDAEPFESSIPTSRDGIKSSCSQFCELEPSEGVEPPSSTNEVDALPLSYLGTMGSETNQISAVITTVEVGRGGA
jgi:hypothetical protein